MGGEMKQVKISFTIDPYWQMKAARKKKIEENKRVKAAISKNKIEYKDTVVADSKKWNPKKLEDEMKGSVLMMFKMFDTGMAFIDKPSWDKKLEDKVIKKYNDFVKRVTAAFDEKAEAIGNDKPDDKKLKKGVQALGKIDGNAPKSALGSYNKWMKRCNSNWGNIEKLEKGIRQHSGEQKKLAGEASKHEEAGDEGAENKAAKKAQQGANREQQIADKMTQKRDQLLNETKSLYRDETSKLFKALHGVVGQLNEVQKFASEMKRNPQISDSAQKTIQSAKGLFKTIKTQEAELKKLENQFESQMTKLDRARNAGARPKHAAILVSPHIVKNIESACRQAADMHKKLRGLYKAAK